jgi:hypothetical protein
LNEPLEYAESDDVEFVRRILRLPLDERLMLLFQLEAIADEANGETPQ